MKLDKKIKLASTKWTFKNTRVVKNFDNHISNSIPLYNESHNLTSSLSNFFLKDESKFYDIGCSTGKLIEKVSKVNKSKKVKYFGIDNSKQMISYAKRKKLKNCKFIFGDITKKKIEKSDMIVSSYTMQFIPPKNRQLLYDKIYKSLNWGGAFVMYEKIRGSDARFQDIMNFLYFDFKSDNHFEPVDILNKERSLRGVMEPYTLKANMEFLKRAGFKDITTILQYVNFTGILAIK